MSNKMRFVVIGLLIVGLILGASALMAQSGNVWTLSFFNNAQLIGTPTVVFNSSFLNFNWGSGSPHPSIPVDNFSGRFTTSAFFNSGIYRFTLLADDDIRLFVNGQIWADTFGRGQAGKPFTVNVPLVQGFNSIQVDYAEYGGLAFISVNWELVKGTWPTPVPTVSAPPPSANSVTTRYGDYTPCIRQNIHQANCFRSDGRWDSPNLGSIQMEPRILVWGNCTPSQQVTQVMRVGQPAELSQCSRTEAGWFPVGG